MGYYHLTEAYSSIYNPRLAEENALLHNNLRFVDFLLDEDIQEVMESLLWEFMDYGNTLEESYNLINSIFSDNILEELLYEMQEFYIGEGIGSRLQSLGSKIERGERRVGGFVTRQQQNLKARQAQVTSGLQRARQAITNAPGQVRQFARTQAQRAQTQIDTQRGKARAQLGQLARRGVSKLASAAERGGRALSTSGAAAHTKQFYSPSGGTTPVMTMRDKPVGASRRERAGSQLSRAAQSLRQSRFGTR